MNAVKKIQAKKSKKHNVKFPFAHSSKRVVLFISTMLYCITVLFSVFTGKSIDDNILHSLEFIIIASICGVAVSDIFAKRFNITKSNSKK